MTAIMPGGYQVSPPAAHAAVSAGWPLAFTIDETVAAHTRPGRAQAHLRCGLCRQSVACLSPDVANASGYLTTPADLAARTLAHIRQSHEDSLPVT